MNREEKRQFVTKMHKEGRTMREIAKEVHMSFGDIGSITRKENEDKEPKSKEKSQESQALKLFRNGKNPVDVAIILDLSPSKAEDIYKEFWKLRGLYKLHDFYELVKHDISLLVKVHDSVKKYDFDKKDIINIVNFADKYIFLEEEIQELEIQFDNLLKQRHDANDSLQSAKKELERVTDEIDTYDEISDRKKVQIENLNNEIMKLENIISQLKENDECYSKFEKFAEEKLDSIMKERRQILSLAVDTVIESLKTDADNKTPFEYSNLDKLNQDKHLDLCEQLFDKLLKQLMDSVLFPIPDQVIRPAKTENY
jgi:DNA repair ATPase RecN